MGNLCNNPSLLHEPGVELSAVDFYKDIHKIAYSTINNLTLLSPERECITAIEIENYLSESPAAYKRWTELNGFAYMEASIKYAETNSFHISYERVKKFSLLRALVNQGIDIKDIYNYDEINLDLIDQYTDRLDKMSTQDILNHFSLKIVDLKEKYVDSADTLTYHIGDDIDNLIEELRKQPKYGLPFGNKFYNTIFKGMMGGKLLLRSADSGDGKTRNNLKDLVMVTMSEIWDHDKGQFVENPFVVPGLYIGTEEGKLQTQENILSIVSGVAPDVLTSGILAGETLERVLKANEIIKSSELYAHRDDDFSVKDIEMVIEKFIIEKNIKVAVFDYIQITPKISRTAINDFGGSQKRDDQILEYFSSSLKDIAEKYQIFILSGTQLNRNHKSREMRDSASLAGGSSTARKVDFGIQLYKPTQEDLKLLEPILSTGEYETPNYSHWIYKNRSGRYDSHIIWTRMDLGVMREKELFVTDQNYELVDIDLTDITIVDGEKDIKTHNKHKVIVPETDNLVPF